MKRIKNRIHGRVIAAVTVAAAFLIGAAPMTAYAGGYDCSCEHKCTDDYVNPDCDLCKIDYKCCCGDEERESEDPEPVEVPEEPEEEAWGPLTPDGNMTLVDDYGAPEKSGKQFITVVTKSGNYFNIIIDRDDNGTETVHFLNMVDEADLLALMDEDAVNDYIASKEAQETEPTVIEEPTQTEEPEPVEESTEPEKKKSSAGALILVLILGLGGGGAYLYFTKMKNKKPKQETTVDPDADYNEDEENYYAEALKEEVQEVMKAEEEAKAKRASEIDFDSESEEDPAEDEE